MKMMLMLMLIWSKTLEYLKPQCPSNLFYQTITKLKLIHIDKNTYSILVDNKGMMEWLQSRFHTTMKRALESTLWADYSSPAPSIFLNFQLNN